MTAHDSPGRSGSVDAGASSPGRPEAWLVRHGETEWSRTGRHTGRTDVPLTEVGRSQARRLADRLGGRRFALVLSSPMKRALQTAHLAGFGDRVEIVDDLREWDYGDYEGLTTTEIRQRVPGWTVWTHPAPGGETSDALGSRGDRVIERIRSADGDVLVWAHGHLLRVLAARWIGLDATAGGRLALGTATVSVLGWEHDARAIRRWNVEIQGRDPRGRAIASGSYR